MIGCDCEVCQSPDKKTNAFGQAYWLGQTNDAVVDSGPDFRYQMLRKRQHLDSILFTHPHKDHVAGLDDVRAYNYLSGKPMEIYANEMTGNDHPGISLCVCGYPLSRNSRN